MPKFLELFAGAGGMTMGFEAAGWECVGHAEIEPHARAVLRHKWPKVPLHGDVAQLDGRTLPDFDLLTFGAPCQDLSIAGKRAGMTEGSGTRSSLFFEAIRIWKESSAPLALYENVLGAYSSNNGKDFAAVLSAFVGAAVPVPADGWRGAGVASGPAGIAAWRTVDLQHFGWNGDTTPQRRRRVFVLGTRTGDYDPAEVLLVRDGLLGHLAASGEAGEGTADDAVASVDGESGCLTPWDNQSKRVFSANGVFPTLGAAENSGQQQQSVLTYEWHGADTRFKDTNKSPTLNTRQDNGQGQVVVLRNREGKPGGGKGPLVSEEKSLTLGTSNDQVVFTTGGHAEFVEANAVSSKRANGGDVGGGSEAIVSIGVPRRLMPIECERLMGWPDGRKSVIFSVCSGHQVSRVSVGNQSLKLPRLAGSAESAEAQPFVSCVGEGFLQRSAQAERVVHLRVEINGVTGHVTIASESLESSLSAKCAVENNTAAHLVLVARTALSNARPLAIAVPEAQRGVGGFHQSVPDSTDCQNGERPSERSGHGTNNASGAGLSGQLTGRSTTLAVGASSPNCDSRWTTLCCSVVDAINGSILAETLKGVSYDCEVMIDLGGHTAMGTDEQGRDYALSDTARYKLCGNGVGSPVTAWIGMRLKSALDNAR